MFVYRIRPERRRANNLNFYPSKKIAPYEIHRFISYGSGRAWEKQLAARAGTPSMDNADGYLARQILTTGLALASILDEFHPQQIL